jgi:alpha/beta superfamily hydrolase
MARRIESLFIEGPAGKIEAILEEPEEGQPREVCLVCHPHPLGGGTMHNKVVYRMARALRLTGSIVLRFNFRGVGRSEGEHARGIGEIEDARAALEWLQARYPDLPYSLAGFSFGSMVVSKLGCELGTATRLIAAGFPTRKYDASHLQTCALPKYFVQSSHDEFGPQAELEQIFQNFAEPKRLQFVAATDHFFAGSLDEFEAVVKATSQA